MAYRVLIVDCDHGFFDPEKEVAEQCGVQLQIESCRTADQLFGVLKGHDALLCQRFSMDRKVMERLSSVKVITRYGSGVDNVDLPAATAKGIKITYFPYFCFDEVATHALAFILNCSRQITTLSNEMKKNPQEFIQSYGERFRLLKFTERLGRQTLGIVGFGKIGRQLAFKAQNLGFQIVACDPYVPKEVMESLKVEKLELLPLVEKSDFLSLHVPLTDETRGMINSVIFEKMKPSAYLINASRGPVVLEKDLIVALERNRLAGAALDVTEEEPLPVDHPFYRMPQVILTPHVAFYSRTSLFNLKREVMISTVNALRGEGEFILANPEVTH